MPFTKGNGFLDLAENIRVAWRLMMKWNIFRRRSSVAIAVLAIALLAGTLTSTANAMFRGRDVQAKNFSVTYVGVTGPVDEMFVGLSDLVLKQVDGKFVGKRKSEMTVSMLRNGFIGTKLMMNRPCDDSDKFVGWCIDEGRKTWAVTPQMIHAALPMNDTSAMFGPAFITQVVDGDGYDGFATYRVTVVSPADTATEGAVVTISIDGYLSKIKASGGAKK